MTYSHTSFISRSLVADEVGLPNGSQCKFVSAIPELFSASGQHNLNGSTMQDPYCKSVSAVPELFLVSGQHNFNVSTKFTPNEKRSLNVSAGMMPAPVGKRGPQ